MQICASECDEITLCSQQWSKCGCLFFKQCSILCLALEHLWHSFVNFTKGKTIVHWFLFKTFTFEESMKCVLIKPAVSRLAKKLKKQNWRRFCGRMCLCEMAYCNVAVALHIYLVAAEANEVFALFEEDLTKTEIGQRKRWPKRKFTFSVSLCSNSTKCKRFSI